MAISGDLRKPADFFAGIRVLDLTASLAGPWCTKFLADLGCEVVKIESCEHYDLTRGPSGSEDWRAYARRGTDKPYECADTFLEPNRGKLGCTLDLKSSEGYRLFLELIAISDIVVENFAPGQMEKFGLGYAALSEVNPRIIYAAMPSLGSSGPEMDYVGYGNTVECLSGIAAITGYPGGPPMISEMWFGDPAAGLHGAGAIAMALLHREETGLGSFVEVPQVEGLSCWLGDSFMDYSLNHRTREPIGNASREGAWPHGVYPCLGEDEWVAIAINGQEQRDRLLKATKISPSQTGTGEARQFLDEALAVWTATKTKCEAMQVLQESGVPASAVLYNRDLFEDTHLLERQYFQEVRHPFAGAHLYPGTSWRLDGERVGASSAAPMLGEHNEVVFKGLLGVSDDEFQSLKADGVIGNKPTSDRWGG
jgi:crotonobetainyl-CoA:carnitine CoA-transferase CaiB-like acyl-CoA transferase